MIERSTFANSKYISAASLTRQRDAAATYLQNVRANARKKTRRQFFRQRHILTYDRINFEFLKGKAETLNSRH